LLFLSNCPLSYPLNTLATEDHKLKIKVFISKRGYRVTKKSAGFVMKRADLIVFGYQCIRFARREIKQVSLIIEVSVVRTR